jgi:hypothetical protein
LLLILAATQLRAADAECSAFAASTPSVRLEGLTGFLGDLVLPCTGGTPAAAPPTVRLDLFANPAINFTSRILDTVTNATEAVLLIGEPTPANQLLCQTPMQPLPALPLTSFPASPPG